MYHVTDAVLALLQKLQAQLDGWRGVQSPNRWRLRRLYRRQQRYPHPGPRETYDELIESLRDG